MKVHKPWGYYEVVSVGEGYQVKRLGVNPGHKLSLQRHQYREEHWYVVKGTATVTKGNNKIILQEGKFVDIDVHEWHRLANNSIGPLTIIEVQRGEYLGEDDIERIEDDYNRI